MNNLPSELIVNLGFYGGTCLFLLGAVLLVTLLGKVKMAKRRKKRRDTIREENRLRDAIRDAKRRQEDEDWLQAQLVKRIRDTSLGNTMYIPRYVPVVPAQRVIRREDDTNIIPRYSDASATAIFPSPDREIHGPRQTRG